MVIDYTINDNGWGTGIMHTNVVETNCSLQW